MAKRRKFGLGEYPNALTSEMASQVRLDKVSVDWFGDGNMVDVYFRPLDTAVMIQLGDISGQKISEVLPVIMRHIAERVVDPRTGNPLRTYEEWMKMDSDLVLEIVQSISGIQFGIGGEEEKEEGAKTEEKVDPN